MKIGYEVEGKFRGLKTLFLRADEHIPEEMDLKGIEQIYFGADKTEPTGNMNRVKELFEICQNLEILMTVETNNLPFAEALGRSDLSGVRTVLRFDTKDVPYVIKVETPSVLFMFEEDHMTMNELSDPLYKEDRDYELMVEE